MVDDTGKVRVEKATVRLPDLGGLGVLVRGNFIGTATHCVEWEGTATMAFGHTCPANVVTADGDQFRMQVAAADPVSDMAVLQAMDDQVLPDDAARFEEWQQRVVPIPLKHLTLRWEESCPAFVLTHEGKWVAGTVTRYSPEWNPMGHMITLRTEEQIKPGTSGGPVVTEDAHLLGVISVSSGDLTELIPVAHLALPKWVLERMAWTGPDAEEMDRVRRIMEKRLPPIKIIG